MPCQLWFFDRSKERDEARRDQVLMVDARNVYRKVSRAICDFSPEQQQNIAAIVWLYRGQGDRFLKLVESYLVQALAEGEAELGLAISQAQISELKAHVDDIDFAAAALATAQPPRPGAQMPAPAGDSTLSEAETLRGRGWAGFQPRASCSARRARRDAASAGAARRTSPSRGR